MVAVVFSRYSVMIVAVVAWVIVVMLVAALVMVGRTVSGEISRDSCCCRGGMLPLF